MTRIAAAALVVAGLALAGGTAGPARGGDPAALRIRLRLSAPAGAPPNEVVRGGVPFPRDLGVADPSALGLWRADASGGPEGEWVPAQWRVVSRWDGAPDDVTRPARWAIVQFPARGPGEFALRADAPPRAALADVATDRSDSVAVDTGPLRFTASKDRFAPLEGLRTVTVGSKGLGGGVVERPVTRDGGLDVRLTLAERDASGVALDRTVLLSRSAVSEVVLEENGPVRAVIRVRGRFIDSEGRPLHGGFLGYTLRLWADRGSDRIRAFFTLENNGTAGPATDAARATSSPVRVRLRECSLVVPTTFPGGRFRGSTSSGAWDVESFGPGTDFRLEQSHETRDPRDESRNFRYEVTRAGRAVAGGDRSDGGLEADDGVTSVAAAVRHFWQSFPKSVTYDDGRLEVGLWPRRGGERVAGRSDAEGDADDPAYVLDGGRHKTHEVLLAFAPSGAAPLIARRAAVFQEPPEISPDPVWIRRSGAVAGAFALVEGRMPAPSLDEARARLETIQNAIVDRAWAEPQGPDAEIPPISVREQRETRGHALAGIAEYDLDLYGWRHFGDLPHAGGYASGHHDWVRGLLLNWLRHGKREYLDLGVEALRHRTDIAQYHCRDRTDAGGRFHDGFQRADRGLHGLRAHPDAPPTPEGTWLEGLLLAHAVTGDPRAMECATENADAFLAALGTAGLLDVRAAPAAPARGLSPAGIANSVRQLLAFHEFTGDPRARDAATLAFRRGLLDAEERLGLAGFLAADTRTPSSWPVVSLVRALVETHRITGDPAALAMLLRVLTFLREGAVAGGEPVGADEYRPLQLAAEWSVDGGRLEPRAWTAALNFTLADGCAYAYARTRDPLLLEFARRTWRDGVVFLQAPPNQGVAADFVSPASYAVRREPGNETRIGAWILGDSQYVLALEDALRADSGGPPAFTDDAWFVRRRDVLSARPVRRPSRAGSDPLGNAAPEFGPWRASAEVPTARAESPIVLDDSEATFAGAWDEVRTADAHGGAARVANAPRSAAEWAVRIPAGGTWRVSLHWPAVPGVSRSVPVVVRQDGGWTRVSVDQSRESDRWRLVASVVAAAGRTLTVTVGGDPAETTPVGGTPTETTPVGGTPTETTPVGGTPTETTIVVDGLRLERVGAAESSR